MSQGFKLSIDRMREGNPARTDANEQTEKNDGDQFETPGHGRMVCFILANRTRKAFPYAYLANATFEIAEELNKISLDFTQTLVTLEGYCLLPLFEALLEQRARLVRMENARYAETHDEGEAVVVSIKAEPKNQG